MAIRTVGALQELGPNLQNMFKLIFANQDLCKLIYYDTPDPLSGNTIVNPKVTLKDLVKVVPDIGPNETAQTKLVLVVGSGKITTSNDQYQTLTMTMGVYTPLKSWIIKDANLRPFKILGLLIETLDGKTVQGLGTIEARDFEISLLTTEVSCYNLTIRILLNA